MLIPFCHATFFHNSFIKNVALRTRARPAIQFYFSHKTMLWKKFVDVFSVYKSSEDDGFVFVEKAQPEISDSYSVGSYMALQLLVFGISVRVSAFSIDSIIFFVSPTFIIGFSPAFGFYAEVRLRWPDEMGIAEANEILFQSERIQAYTAAYQQAENVSYYYILPDVYGSGKNRKFC